VGVEIAVRPCKLLIFDWDGTLADSAQQIVSAMQQAILGLQLPPRRDEEIRVLIGLGLNECLQILYPEIEVGSLRGLLEGYRKQWVSGGGSEAPLFSGALDAVQRLHAQGYRIAIATGKARRGLDRSLRHHPELSQLVINSRCADESASKPDPLMLTQLLEAEGLTADQALMIGDTSYDMAMASAIGMRAVGVACGVHDPVRMLKAGGHSVIDDVSALPAWIAARSVA
jgi:phosphoglycolate phosphatase